MHQITVPADLSQTLGDLASQVVVCDPSGRALGFFSPLPDRQHVDDLQLEPPLSIAETEELRKTKTGKPLAEILARLNVN